jgi:transcriptional regulator with XRE-family HTH domain
MEIDGKKICEVRKLKGLTQEKFAELANVNLRTIQRIESNSGEPHGNTLNSICDVLGIKIEDILIRDDKFTNGYVYGYKLAPKWKRLFANFLEFAVFFVIVVLPVIFYMVIIKGYNHPNDFVFITGIEYMTPFSLFVGALFYPFFTGNLGHRIFGLKVISSKTGEDYNKASDGAIREFLKYIMSYFIIPFIWILWDEKNQNLYDKFTMTFVVEK